MNQIFAETYKEPKLYPYTEADYSVMALDIAEDLTLIRVDLPEKALAAPLCYRIYITFNPQTKKAGYYTIEMTAEKEVRALGQILPDGRVWARRRLRERSFRRSWIWRVMTAQR